MVTFSFVVSVILANGLIPWTFLFLSQVKSSGPVIGRLLRYRKVLGSIPTRGHCYSLEQEMYGIASLHSGVNGYLARVVSFVGCLYYTEGKLPKVVDIRIIILVTRSGSLYYLERNSGNIRSNERLASSLICYFPVFRER